MSGLIRKTPPPLTRSEASFYARLRALTGRDDPLRLIWQVLNSRPAVAGSEPVLWLVPSSRDHSCFYQVNIEARTCTCSGFHHRYHCSHLSVADFAARLLFELSAAQHTDLSISRPALPSFTGTW